MIKCPYCGSNKIIKAGVLKNKRGLTQKYKCKECNRHFVRRDGFQKMKTPSYIIITALDLRVKGLSFGKIKLHIKEKYGVEIHRSNILYWERKYANMIDKFTCKFKLFTSENLHADEVFFREKGQRGSDFLYYWDCIDYDTKYIVADHISYERNEQEAIIFLNKVKNSLGSPPVNFHTDNSYDYPPAIRRVFGRKSKVKHIHFPAWKRKFRNNPIERFHNTLKENYKVMRRFVNKNSAYSYLTLFRNYYNFIRPHKSLNWRTPAEAAGFGKWNWKKLIEKLLRKRMLNNRCYNTVKNINIYK